MRSAAPRRSAEADAACYRAAGLGRHLMSEKYSATQQDMVDLFQRRVEAELKGDLDTTMATMTADPHLNHVPVMAGGVGRDGVRAFYRDHLVGKFFPPDVQMVNVSRTVGDDQVV